MTAKLNWAAIKISKTVNVVSIHCIVKNAKGGLNAVAPANIATIHQLVFLPA